MLLMKSNRSLPSASTIVLPCARSTYIGNGSQKIEFRVSPPGNTDWARSCIDPELQFAST